MSSRANCLKKHTLEDTQAVYNVIEYHLTLALSELHNGFALSAWAELNVARTELNLELRRLKKLPMSSR